MTSVDAASNKRPAVMRLRVPSIAHVLLMVAQPTIAARIRLILAWMKGQGPRATSLRIITTNAATIATVEICKGARAAIVGIANANPNNTGESDCSRNLYGITVIGALATAGYTAHNVSGTESAKPETLIMATTCVDDFGGRTDVPAISFVQLEV